jgi:hypothetical protein
MNPPSFFLTLPESDGKSIVWKGQAINEQDRILLPYSGY